jgi:hypothetical protein
MGEGLGGWGARHPALGWQLAKAVSVPRVRKLFFSVAPPSRPAIDRPAGAGRQIDVRSIRELDIAALDAKMPGNAPACLDYIPGTDWKTLGQTVQLRMHGSLLESFGP